jgi:hypothetical protein
MSEMHHEVDPVRAAGEVVGRAIENLAAARLARAFIPLAAVSLAGIAQALSGLRVEEGLALALAAPLAAGASLAYALRVVQKALGRKHRPWMTLAVVASVVPPGLAVYVIGWRGLREVAAWSGPSALLAAVGFVGLGVWTLRTWLRILELQSLSRAMGLDSLSSEGGNGSA